MFTRTRSTPAPTPSSTTAAAAVVSRRGRFAGPVAAVLLGAALFAAAPVGAASAASTPGISPSAGMPGTSTTGVPDGTALRVHEGDLKITVDGTVIDGYDIRGLVWVEAANVTIKNSIVRGRTVSANIGLVNAQSTKVKNLNIEFVELAPTTPQVYLTGIYGHDFTLRDTDIHHVVDAVHILGNNVRVFRSWLHDLSHFEVDAQQNGGPTHDDDIQIQSGTGFWFKDNVISGAHNAAMQVTQDRGAVSTILFENNIVSGGSCSLNIAQKGKVTTAIPAVTIRNNNFGANQYNCNAIIDAGTLKTATITGNTRTDLKAIKIISRTTA